VNSAPVPAAVPAPRSAAELAVRLAAERDGKPFLLFRDAAQVLSQFTLAPDAQRLTLGRGADNDLALGWDGEISRVHAELVSVGGEWTVADPGLSRNGTYLNGELVRGQRRLRHGDILRLGGTLLAVAMPASAGAETTLRAATQTTAGELTPIQRRILIELCRPLVAGGAGALPATNQVIADAVHLSVAGVKSQLRSLTDRFGYGELPQQRKRLALAERALALGLGGAD
jgi:pSer/pThr/pTyr-binding forkhead associated (FHA) protein